VRDDRHWHDRGNRASVEPRHLYREIQRARLAEARAGVGYLQAQTMVRKSAANKRTLGTFTPIRAVRTSG